MRYSLVLAVALVACQPPETSPRSGARSLTEYTPEVSPEVCGELEPLIDSFEVGCTPTDFVYTVNTTAWTGSARLNLWRLSDKEQSVNEEHTFTVVDSADDCSFDVLERVLTASQPLALLERDLTTTFSCDDSPEPPEKPDDRDEMTFAIRLYDTNLRLSDCLIWGANVDQVLLDPTGAGASLVPDNYPVSDGTELYSCRVLEE